MSFIGMWVFEKSGYGPLQLVGRFFEECNRLIYCGLRVTTFCEEQWYSAVDIVLCLGWRQDKSQQVNSNLRKLYKFE